MIRPSRRNSAAHESLPGKDGEVVGAPSLRRQPGGGGHAAIDLAVQRVALWGVVVSVALVALTVSVALLSHSFALTATAVDCVVDVVAALMLWLGLKLSERKTTAFPFGLYKIENLLQVAIALLIFTAAYEIARRALTAGNVVPAITWWILAGVLVTIAATWAYGWYATR